MNWTPLESDPEVLTQYMHVLGIDKNWQIMDVFGLDEEMLGLLPKPVKSFILLFPVSDKYEAHRRAEDAELKEKKESHPKELFFMEQNIHNACGTIAIIHAVANSDLPLADGSIMKEFLATCKGKTPAERATTLQNETSFSTTHENVASAGLTDPNEPVLYHFIALVDHLGTLYELDGRKSFPISHGPTDGDFVKSCARVCREFMVRDPENVNFNIMAIAPM